jgi:hypothetical protein
MQLKVGVRYRSQVCETEIIVVRAPDDDVELACGGHPMVESSAEPDPSLELQPQISEGTLLGKRYTDGGALEVLVVRPGRGALSVAGSPLAVMEPRVLPSSD